MCARGHLDVASLLRRASRSLADPRVHLHVHDHVVDELHVAFLVVLAIEGLVADGAAPLSLLVMNGTLMGEQIGTKTERETALRTGVRTLTLMYGTNMCLEMGLCLELEVADVTGEVAHLVVNDLRESVGARVSARRASARRRARTWMCLVRSLRAPNRRPQCSHACGRSFSCTRRVCRASWPRC